MGEKIRGCSPRKGALTEEGIAREKRREREKAWKKRDGGEKSEKADRCLSHSENMHKKAIAQNRSWGGGERLTLPPFFCRQQNTDSEVWEVCDTPFHAWGTKWYPCVGAELSPSSWKPQLPLEKQFPCLECIWEK